MKRRLQAGPDRPALRGQSGGTARDTPATGAALPVVLIACSASKLDRAAPARDLYTGQLFRAALRYAELVSDRIYVLSAKHHVLALDDVVEPYDVRLGRLRHRTDVYVGACTERELARQWRIHVRCDLMVGPRAPVRSGDRVLMLAGELYRRGLVEDLVASGVAVEVPLAGLGIGQQKAELARLYREEARARASRLDGPRPWEQLL